uniref:Uncharacterized protein n=1 Tax=Vespula pensylvanica TaxID=30213 RepID=A0A834NS37_VESPE|nr:hypothetical protein H0235_011494 [Vespula pensylvanica]
MPILCVGETALDFGSTTKRASLSFEHSARGFIIQPEIIPMLIRLCPCMKQRLLRGQAILAIRKLHRAKNNWYNRDFRSNEFSKGLTWETFDEQTKQGCMVIGSLRSRLERLENPVAVLLTH